MNWHHDQSNLQRRSLTWHWLIVSEDYSMIFMVGSVVAGCSHGAGEVAEGITSWFTGIRQRDRQTNRQDWTETGRSLSHSKVSLAYSSKRPCLKDQGRKLLWNNTWNRLDLHMYAYTPVLAHTYIQMQKQNRWMSAQDNKARHPWTVQAVVLNPWGPTPGEGQMTLS